MADYKHPVSPAKYVDGIQSPVRLVVASGTDSGKKGPHLPHRYTTLLPTTQNIVLSNCPPLFVQQLRLKRQTLDGISGKRCRSAVSLGTPVPSAAQFPTEREGYRRIQAHGDNLTAGCRTINDHVPRGEELRHCRKAMSETTISADVWVCDQPACTVNWMVPQPDANGGDGGLHAIPGTIGELKPCSLVPSITGGGQTGKESAHVADSTKTQKKLATSPSRYVEDFHRIQRPVVLVRTSVKGKVKKGSTVAKSAPLSATSIAQQLILKRSILTKTDGSLSRKSREKPLPLLAHFPSHGGGSKKILAYGDSLTAGYNMFKSYVPYGEELGKGLRALKTPADVWVCGHPGRTADWMVAQLDATGGQNAPPGLRQLVKGFGPFDLVMIMAGTNDLGRGSGPESVFSKLVLLHSACHKLGVPTLALTVPPNRGAQSGQRHDAWKTVNRLLSEWSRSDQAPTLLRGCVDTGKVLPYDEENGQWETDGLHYSPQGYNGLGRKLSVHVAQHLNCQKVIGKQRSNTMLSKNLRVQCHQKLQKSLCVR